MHTRHQSKWCTKTRPGHCQQVEQSAIDIWLRRNIIYFTFMNLWGGCLVYFIVLYLKHKCLHRVNHSEGVPVYIATDSLDLTRCLLIFYKRLWISWFPRLRFCGCCWNLKFMIMTVFKALWAETSVEQGKGRREKCRANRRRKFQRAGWKNWGKGLRLAIGVLL